MKKETNTERIERLKQIVLSMPEKPGSYQYYDAEGTIIYVGKAKNLKRRVSSYFHKEVDRFKTKVLVSKIENITYTVVNTEEDALLLENALIKKYNPRYNVLLKDGKTYPSICITGEMFPRIFKTRTINKKFGQYYGPYSHLGSMYTVLELIKKLYHPRTCRFPLTKDAIESGKYKPCLEYHIKNCGAPCIGKQTYEEYQANIAAAREILKGNTRVLSEHIHAEMMKMAEELRFEEAEELKRKYILIDQFCAKSEVVSHTITDVDVFSISPLTPEGGTFNSSKGQSPLTPEGGTFNSSKGQSPLTPKGGTFNSSKGSEQSNQNNSEDLLQNSHCSRRFSVGLNSEQDNKKTPPSGAGGLSGGLFFINYMHVKNGTINQSFTYEYKRKLDESDEELLLSAIIEIRDRFASTAKEIIVPFEIDWKMENVTFFVPQRGDKKHLLELSQMNCRQYRFDRLKQQDKLNPEQKYTRLMVELKEKLHLEKLPYHIELFDNSNISGSDAVAGCVVYKGMKPSKKDYRKYNIKTVEGPDDYASMQETTFRRYSRMLEENEDLPNLIICDGGLGQMHCVRDVIEGQLHTYIPIAGLAKDDKHRTNELLFLEPSTGDCKTVQLRTDSELFHALTRMQDEVHRYAITFHRDKRSKHALHSELDDIKGIGPKAKDALLAAFKSVKKIREATTSEEGKKALREAIGASKATIIIEHYNK